MNLKDYVTGLQQTANQEISNIREDVSMPEPQQQMQALPESQPVEEISLSEFVKEQRMKQLSPEQINPTTGDPLPYFADGTSPQTAIQKSPLNELERGLFQTGNIQGNVKKLKETFQNATVDKNGNVKVQKEGLWYEVDPAGLGSGSAWDKTRELLKDIFDLTDEAALTAVTVGAATLTGGSSLLAQGAAFAASGAASELARTSFGRLAGTYEASPEEQLQDIALEGVMSGLGGVIFPVAGKTVGSTMSKSLSGMKKLQEKVGPVNFMKMLDNKALEKAGIDSSTMKRAVDRAPFVSRYLKYFDKYDEATVAKKLKKLSSDSYFSFLNGVSEGVELQWNAGKKLALNKVSPNFVYSKQEVINPLRKKWVSRGLIDSKGKLLDKDTMIANLSQKGDMRLAADLKSNPRVYNQLEVLHKNYLTDTRNLNGKRAVDDIFKSLKELTKDAKTIRKFASKESHDGLVSLVDDFNTSFRNSFDDFADKSAGRSEVMQIIKNTRSEHRRIQKSAAKAIELSKAYRDKGSSAVEAKLNAFMQDRASRQLFINEIDEAAGILTRYSPKLNQELDRIKDLVTASQFHPKVARSSLVDAGIAYSAATALAGYTLAGPLAIAGGIGGGSLIQSTIKKSFAPRRLFDRMAKDSAKSQAVKQTGVKSGFGVLNEIRKKASDPRNRVLAPVLLNQWVDSLELHEQTENQLNQQLQQVTGQ